jgi:hypothetical protein
VASINSGFTMQEQVLGTGTWLTSPRWMNGAIAYKIQSGSDPENPTWSWSGGFTKHGAVQMVTFKPSSAVESEPQPPFGGTIGPYAWMEWPRRLADGTSEFNFYSDLDMLDP